jgi:hypothetical protein
VGWRWLRGIVGGIEAEAGGHDGAASREVSRLRPAVASREASRPMQAAAPREVGKFGQLDAVKNFLTDARVSCRGFTPIIPGMLLILGDIAQPIPQIRFMVSADVS